MSFLEIKDFNRLKPFHETLPEKVKAHFPLVESFESLANSAGYREIQATNHHNKKQLYHVRFAHLPVIDVRFHPLGALVYSPNGLFAYVSVPRHGEQYEYPVGIACAGIIDDTSVVLRGSKGITLASEYQNGELRSMRPKEGVLFFAKTLATELSRAGLQKLFMSTPDCYSLETIYERADNEGKWGWRVMTDPVQVERRKRIIEAQYQRIATEFGMQTVEGMSNLMVTDISDLVASKIGK